MKEFEVTIRIRNNLLKSRRLSAGLSARELAVKIGMGYTTYLNFEGMKIDPVTKSNGITTPKWRKPVLLLAKFWGVIPEVLFPEAVRNIEKVEATRLFGASELNQHLLSDHANKLLMAPDEAIGGEEVRGAIESALSTLTAREQKVLRGNFGFDEAEVTLFDLAKEEGISRDRMHQIKEKALRKLRHPSRSNPIYAALEGEEE